MNYKEYLDLAVKCALKGGAIIKKGFYLDKNVEYKGFSNPVTEFDRKSEEKIVDTILKKYPDHSILTEENLSSTGKKEIKWVIDPLDGTVNFTHQIPFVSVSIGVEIDNDIIAGAVFNPIMNELYWAMKSGGAFMNKKRIHVSETSEKGKSLIVTGFPYEREERNEIMIRPLKEIMPVYCAFRRLGSAAIDMAYVARGSFEGFYEERLHPWDTAAGKIIIEEAGGKVTDYYGERYDIYKKTILATNNTAHEGLLSILRKVPDPE